LEIYRIARDLSKTGWTIYEKLPKEIQYIFWNQYIRALDSVGANIAEWFGRFHYLDSIKFYYNARGSLQESKHWIEILHERNFLTDSDYKDFLSKIELLSVKLNNFITKSKQLLTKS
jgi:four helix bundle protein